MEKEVKMSVSKVFKKTGRNAHIVSEHNETEVVDVVRLQDGAAYATASKDMKRTINLGNFESATLSVFLSVPTPLDAEQIDLAYDFIDGVIGPKMASEVAEIEAYAETRRGGK